MSARHAVFRASGRVAHSQSTRSQHTCFKRPSHCFSSHRKPIKRGNMRCASTAESSDRSVLLFDVMDTLVWDPFYTEMPEFFGMKLPELLKQKDPTAWPDFERGEITEEELYQNFFKDRREVNGPALLHQMINGYRWIEGVEELLITLKRQGVEMHIVTNYPVWYKRIEAKLGVSRYLPWSFVSCEGPMKGLRKPDPKCYKAISDHLGVPPEQLVLIDDRQTNVVSALECGWNALLFSNIGILERDLRKKRILPPRRKYEVG